MVRSIVQSIGSGQLERGIFERASYNSIPLILSIGLVAITPCE
jgi:hypothetical protein